MKNFIRMMAAVSVAVGFAGFAHAADPAYFTQTENMHMSRDGKGVLLVEMNTNGGPFKFNAKAHEEFVGAFYHISRDRDNKIVILTGKGGQWMSDIDFASFGNVSDPDVWSKVHDEGTQIVENVANIRAPMICAVEGKAWVHTEYCALANVVVAGAGATFNDAPHFAGGIVPGDGIFTTWSYRMGATRTEALLLDPKPFTAKQAMEYGLVSEVVADGQAVHRARELADLYLQKPEVTRRNTRAYFAQPIKLALVQQTGYGLALEGSSASALLKSLKASSDK